MYKVVLIDKNIFKKNVEGNRYIDTNNLLECLRIKKVKIYLVENIDDKCEIFIPPYVNDMIEYSNQSIKENPKDAIYQFLKPLSVRVEIEDVLLITSNELLIRLFEKTSIHTCLINNIEEKLNSTYQSCDCECIKKMAYGNYK